MPESARRRLPAYLFVVRSVAYHTPGTSPYGRLFSFPPARLAKCANEKS